MNFKVVSIFSLCFLVLLVFSKDIRAQTDITRQNLHKEWEFAFFEHNKINNPSDYKDLTFRKATVPGTNLRDLTRADLVKKNTSADYENSFYPFKYMDFIYRTQFIVDEKILDKRKILLSFEGLDTICEIFINGEKLAHTENAFIKYEFDVKDRLNKGKNNLSIIFRSPVIEAENRKNEFGLTMPDHIDPKTNFAFLRKPAYSFFWDWGPAIPVSGIYRPVYLKAYNKTVIKDFYVKYDINGNYVSGNVEITAPEGNNLTAEIKIAGKTFIGKFDGNKANLPFDVKSAKLWYPNGEGDPYLYDMTITLKDDSVIDTKTHRIGFRTIEILQDKREDGKGRRFLFKVNGKKIFCRGYNWIPPDNDITRWYYDGYKKLLKLAADGNVNMLRIWGGGYYEDDEFYKICDELGIMVWQDGMFVCSLYPDTDSEFLESVKKELTYNIKRLRNYTSLVIWCGENECHWGYDSWWSHEKYTRFYGTKIWEEIFPELVEKLDPQRFYWNGSPYSGKGIKANHPTYGDTHFWDLHSNCWDFREYNRHFGSFISETGIQSMPDFRTSLTIGEPGDKNLQSFVFDTRNHFESSQKNDRLIKFTGAIFRVSDDFKEAVILSNLAQAMYLKYGIEHWRSLAYDCAGILIWQLNDCWPAISWSAIDYNAIPKASYYLLKKAYQKDIVGYIQRYSNNYSPEINSKGKLFVASEKDGLKKGKITLNVYNVDGDLLETKEFKVELEGRGVAILGEIELPKYRKRRFNCIAEFVLQWDDGNTARNLYTFSRPKHMNLPKPKIELIQKNSKTIIVKTDKFAKGIYFFHPDLEIIFDDNYFDLLPNKEKIVTANKEVDIKDIKPWAYYSQQRR